MSPIVDVYSVESIIIKNLKYLEFLEHDQVRFELKMVLLSEVAERYFLMMMPIMSTGLSS